MLIMFWILTAQLQKKKIKKSDGKAREERKKKTSMKIARVKNKYISPQPKTWWQVLQSNNITSSCFSERILYFRTPSSVERFSGFYSEFQSCRKKNLSVKTNRGVRQLTFVCIRLVSIDHVTWPCSLLYQCQANVSGETNWEKREECTDG